MNWIDINYTFVTIAGYPLSYVEFVGTIAGLLCVWLAAKAHIWTWPIGLVNVACFFAIFYQIQLYSDMFLQAYFFVVSIYGWINWHRQRQADKISVTFITNRQRMKLVFIIVASTALVGLGIQNLHLLLPAIFQQPASYPYLDTFVAILSVIATILMAQRKIENWALWILVDVISVGLYAQKQVLFIALEYAILLGLATWGLFNWIKLWKNEARLGIG